MGLELLLSLDVLNGVLHDKIRKFYNAVNLSGGTSKSWVTFWEDIRDMIKTYYSIPLLL